MVFLRSFDNYIYANMVLSQLKEAGITCYLKDEITLTIDPLLIPALGGIKLMVQPEDLERAQNILSEIEMNYLASLACPVCHHKSFQKIVRRSGPGGIFQAIMRKLFHGAEVKENTFYRCSDCGFIANDLSSIAQV